MAKRINSRSKGKRSELEARDLLRRCGITDAERGARNGVKSGADIHSPMLQSLCVRVEVKNVAAMRLGGKLWRDACAQAKNDSDRPAGPLNWFLLWRPCRGEWALTVPTVYGPTTMTNEIGISKWIRDTIIEKGSINAKA